MYNMECISGRARITARLDYRRLPIFIKSSSLLGVAVVKASTATKWRFAA
jgi:alpha-glucosidase (family GH31 glycosyl hydrolase)